MLILPSNNQTFGFYQGQPSNIGILTQILQPENRQPKPCLPVGLTHWRVAHCCFAAQKARRVLVSGMTQTVYLTTSEIHLNMCASCMNFGMDGLCQCVFSTRRPWLLYSAGPKIFGDWIRTRSKLTHKKNMVQNSSSTSKHSRQGPIARLATKTTQTGAVWPKTSLVPSPDNQAAAAS